MLTNKIQSLWTRTAMMLFLVMTSVVASAQTFVVVDKQGNKITYDVSKVDSVTFQQDPPAFTVFENKTDEVSQPGEGPGQGDPQEPQEPKQEETTYTFDEVKSFSGDPTFLFAHPDTVYVDAEGQDFALQLRTNVEYEYKFSDDTDWISYVRVINNTDSLRFNAGMNPMTERREGMIIFISTDDAIRDTLVVVQYAKSDSRYIDIDWTKTTLDSFDEASGKAVLTFQDKVPVMGDYDVVLLPSGGSQVIRLIDEVKQDKDSKTVTLATREGKMGNLFKDTKFSLSTETGGAQARGKSNASATGPVYTPSKVEIFTGDEYVEIFNTNTNKALARGKAPTEMEKDFVSWEYNQDGVELWSSGVQSLSWDKLNFNIGLKGLFSFDFGEVPFEKVRMGDLKHLEIALEGGFNMEMVMKYLVSSSVEWKKEWELKKDVFNAKFTFMVGTVPVIITVGADLMAEVSLGASGEASITSGITASNTLKCGVEWDAEDSYNIKPIYECEKKMELVGPDIDIKAHAEARATAYPQMKIGIYKVLCPTISPQPYLKAEADGRLVDNSKVAWNAGISTGIDLGLGLSLDLFFWEWQLADMDPINIFDQPIVSLPDEIELQNEKEEQMLMNEQKEVKYHVTNKNYLTGTTYNAPGVLVKFEAEGGEVSSEYDYTDKDGNVSVKYMPKAGAKGGVVKAEVMLGAEPEKEEDAMKAEDYSIEAIDYRLSGGSYYIPEGETTVDVTFKLEQFSSTKGTWSGAPGKTVSFSATNGSVSPVSGVTDANGKVTVTFTAASNFEEGSVTATASGPDPSSWTKTGNATIKAGSGDDIGDEDLGKAAKQKDNVYVIENKKTGETQERSYVSEGSEWNKDQDFVSFSLEDADAEGRTLGMIWGHIPLSMTDVVLALTGETFANSPGGKFGFDVYEGTELSADFACFTGEQGMDVMGNIKPESKIMLRKINSQNAASRVRRAPDEEKYTGEYELLFYLVFKNKTWNSDTHQMEEGDDYEVYGRGVMTMHIPRITSMQLSSEGKYLKVGESTKVNVEQYYEEGAQWDWSDVQIAGQSANYSDAYDGADEGFFTWDAATHTLTSVKPNDNKDVYVVFSLKSKPSVQSAITIATGEGWKYTSFKVGPEEQEVSAGSGGCSFYISSEFEPKDSEDEKFDATSIEIDPESDPDDNFRYYDWNNRYSPRLDVYRSNAAPGEYNLRFRLKSNHSIGCTMKIIIKESE